MALVFPSRVYFDANDVGNVVYRHRLTTDVLVLRWKFGLFALSFVALCGAHGAWSLAHGAWGTVMEIVEELDE